MDIVIVLFAETIVKTQVEQSSIGGAGKAISGEEGDISLRPFLPGPVVVEHTSGDCLCAC